MRRHQRFTSTSWSTQWVAFGPEPGALAVWTLPNFAALAEIADELDRVSEPVQLQAAGTYTDVGQEII
jgi:hypothetical protein